MSDFGNKTPTSMQYSTWKNDQEMTLELNETRSKENCLFEDKSWQYNDFNKTFQGPLKQIQN